MSMAWLQSCWRIVIQLKNATINAILNEFVIEKVSCDEMNYMDMVVELLIPLPDVIYKDI